MQQAVPVPAIDILNLSKHYKGAPKPSVHKLNLTIQPGEVYGFLGPNGAGKSTTIRTLLNFIQPTGGRALIHGLDIVKDSVAIKRRLGYLAGDVALFQKMTGAQFLTYMADLQPIKHPHYEKELIKRFKAEVKKPISTLSKGNRQKIGIIQAFVHEPEVLILDEPTSGLDPLMQEEFFELIAETKARGGAVFVSSHNLSEVQRMCDRVGFIREGKLIREHLVHEIYEQTGTTFSIVFKHQAPVSELRRLQDLTVESAHGTTVQVHVTGSLSPLFALLSRREVATLDRQDTNLEQEFLTYYENEPEAHS